MWSYAGLTNAYCSADRRTIRVKQNFQGASVLPNGYRLRNFRNLFHGVPVPRRWGPITVEHKMDVTSSIFVDALIELALSVLSSYRRVKI